MILVLLAFGTQYFKHRTTAGSATDPRTVNQALKQAGEFQAEAASDATKQSVLSGHPPRNLPETAIANAEIGDSSAERLPTDMTSSEYRSAIWAEIQQAPPKLLDREDSEVDADTAYRIYMFLRWCGITPRTERQAEVRFQRIENEIETATRDDHLSGIKWSANQDFMLYELCRDIPTEVDCRREAVLWLARAVRLGHQAAQIEYYDSAIRMLTTYRPAYISSSLVLLHPEMAVEFKDTAKFALEQAMNTGHPEAYVVMSQAVIDGVIYPRDPILAYAYAHLGELKAMNSRALSAKASHQKSQVSEFLELEEIAEAKQLALELDSKVQN